MEASVVDNFEKDRKDEKRFYALINYFKLLIIGKTAMSFDEQLFHCYDRFEVLGGYAAFNRFLDDFEAGNISLHFDNCDNKRLHYLLRSEAYDLFTSLCDVKSTQSPLLSQAFKDFRTIIKYFDYLPDREWVEGYYSEYALRCALPDDAKIIEKERYQEKIRQKKLSQNC